MQFLHLIVKLFVVGCFMLPITAQAYTSITVFGDSALDGGNDATAVTSYYKINGDPFPVPPGTPHVPVLDFRLSDGYTFIELFAQAQNLFSTTTFFNHAVAGQLASDLALVIPNYLNSNTVDPDGLYVIQVGMNDLISEGRSPSLVSDDVIVAINTLHQEGVEHFLIINSILGGDTPAFINDNPGQKVVARNETWLFNQALQTKINALSFADDIIVFDLGQLTNTLYTSELGLYGAKNNVDACITDHTTGGICDNIEDYLFWDDVHFSKTGNEIIADVLISQMNEAQNQLGIRLNHTVQNDAITKGIPLKIAALTANSADIAIQQVDFYADGNLIKTVTQAPYTTDWFNDQLGAHTITASVTGSNGSVLASNTLNVNAQPSTTPAEIHTFNSSISNTDGSLVVNLAEDFGAVSKVELYYNDVNLLQTFETAPYLFDWADAPDGVYTLTAKVYDNTNQATDTPPLFVTIDSALNNQAPIVSLNNPVSNNNFLSGSLLANASDADGSIDRVDFLVDGEELVVIDDGPYWLFWENVPEGKYVLNAAAYDNNGLRSVSNPIEIFVGNQ